IYRHRLWEIWRPEMKQDRKNFYRLVLTWFRRSVAFVAVMALAIGADKPVKKVADHGLDHPEPPRTEREEKNKLRQDFSRALQRSPRIEVSRKNYIDEEVAPSAEPSQLTFSFPQLPRSPEVFANWVSSFRKCRSSLEKSQVPKRRD